MSERRSIWNDPSHWVHDLIVYGYGVLVAIAIATVIGLYWYASIASPA